jgi:hypothetical protein
MYEKASIFLEKSSKRIEMFIKSHISKKKNISKKQSPHFSGKSLVIFILKASHFKTEPSTSLNLKSLLKMSHINEKSLNFSGNNLKKPLILLKSFTSL